MRRSTKLLALSAVMTTAFATLATASCSLGLDESLIGRGPEAGVPEATVDDAQGADVADSAPPPLNPEGGVCEKDDDCKGTEGCVQARCDLPRKACVFNVCRATACNSSECTNAGSPTAACAAAKPYKFRATQFPVAAPAVGCGGVLARCFTAVYPFVFIGTQTGVLAYRASDPQDPAPDAVPVTGLAFVPVQIIASGSRVYFLGSAQGAGATSRVPLAWADVPPDPFAPTIRVTSVLATLNRPVGDPLVLFPRANDTALLVDLAAAASFASVPIEPPLVEPYTLTSTSVTFTAGSSPVGVSGTRLVFHQINPAGAAQFGFVSNAGSATPMTVADVAIPTATPASGPSTFAQSADGALLWEHIFLTAPPGTPVPPGSNIKSAKIYFLVDGAAANFDPANGFEVEQFGGAPLGTNSVGPIALLDSRTAMVLTAIPANPAQTNVQFVKRGPPVEYVKNADMSPRRSPLAVPVGLLAAAGSNGLGYVLAVDPTPPNPLSVTVYDAACVP